MPTDQDLQIEALYRQGVPLKDIGEMMVPFERTSDLYRQVTAGLIDPEKLSNEQLKSLLAERKQVQAARGMQRDVTGFMRGAVPGMSWGTEPQETASEMVGMALNPLNVAGAALTRASFLPNAIKYSRLGRAVFGAAVGAAEFPAVTGDISDVKYGAALGAGVGAIGAIPKNPLQFLKEKAQLRLPPAAREMQPVGRNYTTAIVKISDIIDRTKANKIPISQVKLENLETAIEKPIEKSSGKINELIKRKKTLYKRLGASSLVPLGLDASGNNVMITPNGVIWSVPGHGAGARY